MNHFQCILFIFGISYVVGDEPGIRLIYLDPATKLYSGNTGVVILELTNGVKATICINQNSLNDAKVACRSMQYSSGSSDLSAVALISSVKTKLAKTYFQNLQCVGTESSLTNCPGYKYTPSVDFKCQNNNQDLSVSCLYNYTFDKNVPTGVNCPSQMLQVDQYGFLKLYYNGKFVYFCGSRNVLSSNEAQLFCQLLCQNSTSARIVQGINMTSVPDIPIGGFNNLSCPADAKSFDNCINVYPYQSDGCMPSDNIGVACTISSLIPDPLPDIVCVNNTMNLLWNLTVHPTIQPTDVSFEYRNSTCSLGARFLNSTFLVLLVSLNDCNNDPKGDLNYIIYSFGARRTFPKVNNVQIKDDQKFVPSCYVIRNSTVVNGPFIIKPTSINGGTGTTDVPVELKMFYDANFQNSIQSLNIPVGTVVFVRVMLINPPANLVLVLIDCYVTSGTKNEYLIQNRCPVRPLVQLNPISDTVTSFNFQSFQISGPKLDLICLTSKCGKNEIGCITKC